jgi:hypothetical protein
MSRRTFLVYLALGGVLRLATITWPGTGDVVVFKIWAYAASHCPIVEIYGKGGTPPERRTHQFGGRSVTVDYPPAALAAVGSVGRAYEAVTGGFANSAALTAAVKVLPLLADVGVTLVLYYAARRAGGGRTDIAAVAALAYWLNPGVLMNGAVLGYLDALAALPVMIALVAACVGRPAIAGASLALALLTKPQAALLAPVVALATVNTAPDGRRVRATVAAGVVGLAVLSAAVLPFVVAGSLPNLAQAMASLGRHRDLSANAANLWWIVTWLMRGAYAVADLGWVDAFFLPVRRPLAIATIVELGYPNPRGFASLVVLAMMGWGLWKHRATRDVAQLAALGGWVVFVYFALGVAAHENHGFLVMPMLALAAALQPGWRPLAWTLSLTMAINLNAFYGIGEGLGYAIPRRLTGLDLTVWLAMLHVAVLVAWTRRLARTPAT